MKDRIRIDSTLLSVVIILTGFLFLWPGLYPQNVLIDTALDFLGMLFILKGVVLRMAARGHKKAHSEKSQSLVTTGPYAVVRNPMYLGSFFIGVGFILLVWPWWAVPVFAAAFYYRFNQQIKKEELFLQQAFSNTYREYCSRTPRLFPSIFPFLQGKKVLSDTCNLEEAFSTKEKRGLFFWPLLAIVMETLQEVVVFHSVDLINTLIVFSVAGAIFSGIFVALYSAQAPRA